MKRKIYGYFLLLISLMVVISQSKIVSFYCYTENSYNQLFENEPLSYNFKFVGKYNLANKVVDVEVDSGFAYLADEEQGLVIVNISQPQIPTLISNYQIEDESVYDIHVIEDKCFLAHGRAGLVILDVANKSNPILLSRYDVGGTVWKIRITDDYLFVVNRNYGIDILDISDIGNPVRVSIFEGQPMDVIIEDSFMYIAAGFSAGLEIINIEDIKNPQKRSELKSELESTVGVAINGNIAFLATLDKGLKIVDISNNRRPKTIGYIKDEGPGETWNVLLRDNFVYLADEKEGLEVLDITDIESPKEIGQFFLENSLTYNLVIESDFILLADYSNGLTIITWKVQQPNPVEKEYEVIDRATLNFNNSVGPFEIDAVLGNETLGLNTTLFLDVGLKSPINVTIEAPVYVQAEEDINLRIRITAEASKFWGAFRGSLSFITPIGSADIVSLADAGIPESVELEAFQTFIGENLTKDTNLQPFVLWEDTILNYTLKLTMTPYFNVTGTAIVEAKVNNEGTIHELQWTKDKEELIIPITIPAVEEAYSLLLEDFQFKIDDLRLDLNKIKFALVAEEIVELYNWTIDLTNFSFLNQLNGKIPQIYSPIVYPEQPNNGTLFYLNGIYPLGDYLIIINFSKEFSLPIWAILLILLGILAIIATPWILIITSSRRKEPIDENRERD